jgi:hypothetical protein
MSYRTFIRTTIQEFPQNLRKPAWIATIASVGVHVVLWIVLPILPLESREAEEPDIPRPVGLVELTPEEQSRIPDFSVPSAELPPIAPINPDLYSLNPPGSQFFEQPFETLPRTPLPSYTPPSLSLLPPLIPPPATRVPPQSPAVPRNIAPPSPIPSPSVVPSPPPSPAPLEGETAVLPELDNLSPDTPPEDTEPVPSLPSPLEDQEELLAALEYNEAGTSQEAALERYTTWFAEVTELLGDEWDGENADIIRIAAPYPVVACPRQLEGAAIVGALVNAEGELVEEPAPAILRSSGYGLFNQLALDLVQEYEFEAGDGQRAYQVYVQFEYDPERCPDAFSQTPEQDSPGAADQPSSSSEESSSAPGTDTPTESSSSEDLPSPAAPDSPPDSASEGSPEPSSETSAESSSRSPAEIDS